MYVQHLYIKITYLLKVGKINFSKLRKENKHNDVTNEKLDVADKSKDALHDF